MRIRSVVFSSLHRRDARLLPPKTIQTPLQLGGPLRRRIGETPRPSPSPQATVITSRATIGIALIDPLALRLSEPLFEVPAPGFVRLRDQLLIRAVEIGVVGND